MNNKRSASLELWSEHGPRLEKVIQNESVLTNLISSLYDDSVSKDQILKNKFVDAQNELISANQSYLKLHKAGGDLVDLNTISNIVIGAARSINKLKNHLNKSFSEYSDQVKSDLNSLTKKLLKDYDSQSETLENIFSEADKYLAIVNVIDSEQFPDTKDNVDRFTINLAELGDLITETYKTNILESYKKVSNQKQLDAVKSEVVDLSSKLDNKQNGLKDKYLLASTLLKHFGPWKRYKILDQDLTPELGTIKTEIKEVSGNLGKYIKLKGQLNSSTDKNNQQLSDLKKMPNSLDVSYLESLSNRSHDKTDISVNKESIFIADELDNYHQSIQSLDNVLEQRAVTATSMLYSKIKEHFYSGIFDGSKDEKKRKLMLVNDLSTKMSLLDSDVAKKTNSVIKSICNQYHTNGFNLSETQKDSTKEWLESLSDYLMKSTPSNDASSNSVNKTYQFDLEKSLDDYATKNNLPENEELQLVHQLLSGNNDGLKTMDSYSERIKQLNDIQLGDLNEKDKEYVNDVLIDGIKRDYNQGYLGFFCKHKDKNAKNIVENFLQRAQSVA
jgi:hypothetical protein